MPDHPVRRFVSTSRQSILRAGILLLVLLATGCSSLAYYGQAIHGQLAITFKKKPIDELIPKSPELKARFEQVQELKRFAGTALDLPAESSYIHYVALGKPYVAWNVVAALEWDIHARQWCYPLVGCLEYRGYFNEQRAQAYAKKLQRLGWQVWVVGATAYSTLGWFRDPVTDIMLGYPDETLAEILFHELAHQKLFIRGDTMFNEGFATAVGILGVQEWLASQGKTGPDVAARLARQSAFAHLIDQHRQRLDELYHSDLPEAEKIALRERYTDELRQQYREFVDQYQSHEYDEFMAGPLNNAQLAVFANYNYWVPAFIQARKISGSWAEFYEHCRKLSSKSPAERWLVLETFRRYYLAQASGENP